MIYKVKIKYPLETVKAQLEEHSKQLGFGILGSYYFKQILKSKGFEIEKEITVYELCNSSAAHKALNVLPEISVYLPCRLSIYEENGETILATIGIEDITNSIQTNQSLKEHLEDIFKNIRALMNSW